MQVQAATVWPRYPHTNFMPALGSSQSKLKVQIEMKCQVPVKRESSLAAPGNA